MKFTKGKWSISPSIQSYKPIVIKEHPNKKLIIESGLDKPFDAISIGTKNGQIALVPTDEIEEYAGNAELIAEAGTVASETGLTPRQLADEFDLLKIMFDAAGQKNKELTEVLGTFMAYYESDFIQVTAKDGRTLASTLVKMAKALKTPKQ